MASHWITNVCLKNYSSISTDSGKSILRRMSTFSTIQCLKQTTRPTFTQLSARGNRVAARLLAPTPPLYCQVGAASIWPESIPSQRGNKMFQQYSKINQLAWHLISRNSRNNTQINRIYWDKSISLKAIISLRVKSPYRIAFLKTSRIPLTIRLPLCRKFLSLALNLWNYRRTSRFHKLPQIG